jgi:uncharacterized protein (TIGR02171 family)
MIFKLLGAIVFAVFFAGCQSDGGPTEVLPYSGMQRQMLLVEGSKDTVILGTNKNGAKIDESPEMEVLLDYDYWVDVHKVTCGEFKSVIDESVVENRIDCGPDSLPVVNVTFFDAVLFANEKSKTENLDTVYEYSSAEFDKDGRCVNLAGLSFHLNRKGFRLPTEAEWVKVASQKDKCLDCFEREKEYVNDYKGIFKNEVLINYAGASSTNDVDERIIKGGASSSLYSRGGTYPVSPSTYDDYIGFRLAIGVIPDAAFLDQGGKIVNSPVKVVSSVLKLWDYTKTSKVKLVFKNEATGNLNYIDYDNESKVVELVDSVPAYHPDISPDGSKVAYCTGIEGLDRKSQVYVRNLDDGNSGIVKLDVESAAIPRWNVLENGDTVITYVTGAGNNSSENSFKSMSTWQVPFANGKFGKPVKLFDGSYHGGVSEDGRLAVTGSKILRANVNGKETVWYNGEQSCNVSLSRDFSKRTSFLDFHSATGEKFVGDKYKVHEILFVADSTGNLIQYVKAPYGYAFDHPEWVTGRVNQNIVATFTNSDGAHSKIVLVHLPDSSITYLVEGDELWHPSLWVRESASSSSSESVMKNVLLDEDSAGFYVKDNEFQEAHWSYKMELVWTYWDSADVVILGSSRPQHGIIPALFSDQFSVVNLASAHGCMHSSYYMALNYVLPHYKKLKYIIIEIALDRLWLTKQNSFFNLRSQNIKGYVYDANHDFWKSGIPEGLKEMTHEVPKVSSYAANLTGRGAMPLNSCGNWRSSVYAERDTAWLDTGRVRLEETLLYLTEIIELAGQKGIKVIGVEMPQNPNYKNVNAYGKYGLRNSDAPEIIEQIESLAKKYSNFTFFDQHKMGKHDYLKGMNYDDDHLCRAGAEQITHRLDSLLKTLD